MDVQYGCKVKCNSTENVSYVSRLGIRHACGPAVPISAASQHTQDMNYISGPRHRILSFVAIGNEISEKI